MAKCFMHAQGPSVSIVLTHSGGEGRGRGGYTQRGPSFHMYMYEQWPPHLCYNAT